MKSYDPTISWKYPFILRSQLIRLIDKLDGQKNDASYYDFTFLVIIPKFIHDHISTVFVRLPNIIPEYSYIKTFIENLYHFELNDKVVCEISALKKDLYLYYAVDSKSIDLHLFYEKYREYIDLTFDN